MANYNPYLVDEIVAGISRQTSHFGLISDEQDEEIELHGYEVTLDGRLVIPRLKPDDMPDSVRSKYAESV